MRSTIAVSGWMAWIAAGCAPEEQLVGTPGDAPAPTQFGFPLADRNQISTRIGVDHDPVVQEGLAAALLCTDYAGRAFPHCYDEHSGTDLMLEGGFDTMDAGSLPVLAAWDGVVVEAVDGNYDRCHTDLGVVTCDGYPIAANMITIEHPDGLRSQYWHLKEGSVAVEVGDAVRCGDEIGLVGSSGWSSAPHLHFEVRLSLDSEDWIDPFAGPYSQDESLWEDQGDDEDLPEDGCTGRR